MKLDPRALDPILESDEVLDLVEAKAVQVAAWAGPGYETQEAPFLGARRRGGGRWRSSVAPASKSAYRDSATNQTLSKLPDGF